MNQPIDVVSHPGRVVQCPACEALFEWNLEFVSVECPYCEEGLTRIAVKAA